MSPVAGWMLLIVSISTLPPPESHVWFAFMRTGRDDATHGFNICAHLSSCPSLSLSLPSSPRGNDATFQFISLQNKNINLHFFWCFFSLRQKIFPKHVHIGKKTQPILHDKAAICIAHMLRLLWSFLFSPQRCF